MKRLHKSSSQTSFRVARLAPLALALLLPAAIKATPYATSLSNTGGTVSFVLNEATSTNDTVFVVSGTVTNMLQLPSNDTNQVFAAGLVQTNLGIPDGPFEVHIKHVGAGVISTNSPLVTFNSVRAIAVNTHPASPYFGWIYVGNSAAGSKGDGLFAFGPDWSDVLGQGTGALSGGYNFGTGGSSAPFHVSVAPDDSVLATDWSDASGNVIALDPVLDSFTYVLKPLEGTAASPVGENNNHGSISAAVIVGTGADRVLYTMDEDYQTDPASNTATEWNSVWQYKIGSADLPWTNAPDRKIMTPYLSTFAGQNQKIEISGHYLYANQRRSNPPQHSLYIVDLNNLMDPSTFNGSTPWGMFWTSQDASLAAGYSDDIFRDTMALAVSPDGKWLATIIAAGSGAITAPDGSTFTNTANEVIVVPLTNGIPNLAAVQTYRLGGASLGRDIAFDAAHNVYVASSGLGGVRSLDIGESAEAVTGSDGTFNLVTPATQVTISASTPLAMEQGTAAGKFTITRSPEDTSNPLTVFYTITGTASNGVDYASIPNSVTIPAGQTSADVAVTPIDDSIPEASESVVLSVKGSGGYSVGFPFSDTVSIADNETPQVQIVSLSTNVYAGQASDYATLRLRRLGDTNIDLTLDASSFAFGGTAVSNVDYYLTNLPFTIPAGSVDYSVQLIAPLNADLGTGSKSISITNLAGNGYTVTNNTAATTLTLTGTTPGTVLFSDDFEDASSANNWDVKFATFGDAPPDYNVLFNYDYGTGGVGNLPAIPPAPHSTNGATHGLYMTVNKADEVAAAAALNLYLKNKDFSGDYALRFDMFLVQNSANTQQSKNETALFGINHSGSLTNWVRNSVPGTGSGANEYESDGIWCTVEADASTTVNFGLWSGPTYTNGAGVVGPTNFLSLRSTATTQIFKKPPFDAGPAAGGVPANTVVNPTPTWVTVELSQIGNTITWKMNNSVILSFVNTNANTSQFTSGTVMLGYNDPWDDIANGSAGSGEACVIYDNVQVVALASAPGAPSISTSFTAGTLNLNFPTQTGHNYTVQWTSDLGSGTWNTLETDPGTGGTVTVASQTQPDARRFYRLLVE